MGEFGVGIIGASPDSGWAFGAHVPAIAATPGLRVAAVATTREESARRAADLLGGAEWFTDPAALAAGATVDLVVVSVRVPRHRELIMAALPAGKPVLSEWPLGASTAEAEEITEAARFARVRGFTVLQGRYDPVIAEARSLVASGALGELQALSVRSSRTPGTVFPAELAYTLDAANAAGTLEVHGGHLLDLLDHLVPGLEVIDGTSSPVRTAYPVTGSDEPAAVTAPDTLSATLRVGRSGIGALTAWDGDPAGSTVIVLQGLDGRLELRTADPGTPALRQPQMAPFRGTLVTAGGTRELAPAASDLPVAARNPAALYRQVAEDLANGTTTAPTFEEAVTLHRRLDRFR
ncbi:Gfo/Idh/MocA family protein [Actinomadura sp. NTSP31]|uniref:Gfo/Idh/MocA family protein n=1 Tax=Actinomadura sp. NTSP31 TaxID=1735447 RepID=UPI0035C16328